MVYTLHCRAIVGEDGTKPRVTYGSEINRLANHAEVGRNILRGPYSVCRPIPNAIHSVVAVGKVQIAQWAGLTCTARLSAAVVSAPATRRSDSEFGSPRASSARCPGAHPVASGVSSRSCRRKSTRQAIEHWSPTGISPLLQKARSPSEHQDVGRHQGVPGRRCLAVQRPRPTGTRPRQCRCFSSRCRHPAVCRPAGFEPGIEQRTRSEQDIAAVWHVQQRPRHRGTGRSAPEKGNTGHTLTGRRRTPHRVKALSGMWTFRVEPAGKRVGRAKVTPTPGTTILPPEKSICPRITTTSPCHHRSPGAAQNRR